MFAHAQPELLAIAALAVLVAIVYSSNALRADGTKASSRARYAVAFIALVVAVLVACNRLVPVVAYGVLCLAMVGVHIADVLQQERERRRRVASLAPRAAADAAPLAWIGIAAASPLMLAPYILSSEQVPAAIMVAICVFLMAAVAWRLASAPVQLLGHDVPSERLRARASRSARAGNTAVLAVGVVFVFIAFVNAQLPTLTLVQRALVFLSLLVGIGLWTWEAWYVRRLSLRACPS